jgi:hypothetical protein
MSQSYTEELLLTPFFKRVSLTRMSTVKITVELVIDKNENGALVE